MNVERTSSTCASSARAAGLPPGAYPKSPGSGLLAGTAGAGSPVLGETSLGVVTTGTSVRPESLGLPAAHPRSARRLATPRRPPPGGSGRRVPGRGSGYISAEGTSGGLIALHRPPGRLEHVRSVIACCARAFHGPNPTGGRVKSWPSSTQGPVSGVGDKCSIRLPTGPLALPLAEAPGPARFLRRRCCRRGQPFAADRQPVLMEELDHCGMNSQEAFTARGPVRRHRSARGW